VDYDSNTDTVYYTEQERPDKDDTRLYNNIDWLELSKDKLVLVSLLDVLGRAAAREAVSSVLALIDAIQDDAQKRGYPVVWHMCTESWAQIERKQSKTREAVEKAATELFETLSAVVDSSCGSCGPEHRAVSDKAIAAARALLKRLEAE